MTMWQEFEDGLQKYLPKSDGEVISVLRRKYHRTNSEFRHSKQCRSILRQCLQRIAARPTRVYMILNDLKATFKLQTTGISLNISKNQSKASPERPGPNEVAPTDLDSLTNGLSSPTVLQIPEEPPQPTQPTSSIGPLSVDLVQDDDVIILDDPSPTVITQESRPSPTESAVPSTSQNPTVSSPSCSQVALDASRRSVVERLERLLSRLSKAIRALEEEELDFDALDSGNSSYLQLDGLKRRYLQVWHRLCDARKLARISGRIVRRRFTYTGCKYSGVNSRIEHLVNDKRKFPDYTDVRRIVANVNREDNLQLSSSAVTELAREVFIDVGHMLKRRRQEDLRQDLGCHLTDDLREEDDPTYYDPTLRRKLAQNKTVGEVRLNAVFDKYVQLQNAMTSPTVSDQEPEVSDHESQCQSVHSSRTLSSEDTDSDEEEEDALCEVNPPEQSSSYEVLSLSSESDSESPQQNSSMSTDQSASFLPMHSSSNQSCSSPLINLTEDENNVSHDLSNGMAIVPIGSSLLGTPNVTRPHSPPIAQNHTRGTTFAMFNNVSQQFFHPGPLIQQTQHASQTLTLTRQFGFNGIGSMMSTTQMATTKLVCQQLLPNPNPPAFYPLFTHNTTTTSRPSRGRLVPSTHHSRRVTLPTVNTPHHHHLGRNEQPTSPFIAPDTETIVLD